MTRRFAFRRLPETALVLDQDSLSQWELFQRRFARNKSAMASLLILTSLYLMSLAVEFIAPYAPNERHLEYSYAPPQALHWNWHHGLHVKLLRAQTDPITFRKRFHESQVRVPVRFLAKNAPVRLLGFFPIERRLLGVDRETWVHLQPNIADEPAFFFMGADKYGRDIFSRSLYGARVSLSVGLVGIVITFAFGIVIGGISGYAGGHIDDVVQRGIEILQSLPQLPLWIALAATLPNHWSALKVYFTITVLLGLLNWSPLARVVRGKVLALREEEYAIAARLLGAGHSRIIFRHLMPNLSTHIIVALTLSVPGMILGETTLSFLGLGLRSPFVSWGVMLQDCLDLKAIVFYPWLLMPVGFIVSVVLCFNFLGDGLNDAIDPHG